MADEPLAIIHVEIPVRSIEASREFYEKVLGWKIGSVLSDETGRFASFGRGEAPAGLLRERADATFGDGTWLYCPVRDLAAALDAAQSLGGKVVEPVNEFPGGAYARIADPDGTVLGLCTE